MRLLYPCRLLSNGSSVVKATSSHHGSVGEESAKTVNDIGTTGRSEIDDDDDTITVDTSSRSTGPSTAVLATTRVVSSSGSTKISGSEHFSGSGTLHPKTNGLCHHSLPTYLTDIDVTSNESLTYGSSPENSTSVRASQMAQAVALFTLTLRAAAFKANNDSVNRTLGPEPQTWKRSQQTPKPNSHSLNDIMHTWDLVERPKDKPVLKGGWVFKRKLGPNREVLKYKARWVARGDMQEPRWTMKRRFRRLLSPWLMK